MRTAVLVALALLTASALHAQRPTVAPPGATASFLQRSSSMAFSESVPRPATYRREGAIVGGAVIGFLGALVGMGFCHFDSPCTSGEAYWAVGGFALGALAGVGIGGAIGSQIPKHKQSW